jgi:ligand-binding sensor domain-containing protein
VVSATGGGVVIFSADGRVERVLTRLDGLPGTRSLTLAAEPSSDAVWIGAEYGVARLNAQTTRLEQVHVFGAAVRDLHWHDGHLVAAVWERGVSMRAADGAWAAPLGDGKMHITALQSHSGKLYAADAGAGLKILEGRAWKRGPGRADAAVFAMVSHEGRLWWGGLDGLRSTDGGVVTIESPGGDVRALSIHRGRLLFAAYDSGVFEAQTSQRLKSWSSTSGVVALASHGAISCVATNDGLFVGRRGKLRRFSGPGVGANDVSAVAEFAGRLWVGSFDRGLYVHDGTKSVRVAGDAIDRRVNALLATPKRLWVATARGLFAVDDKAQVVASFGRADGLSSVDVHSLASLPDGRVAAGTGQGFVIVNRAGVQAFDKKRGLPLRSVWAIAPAGHNSVWLGTGRGLYRYHLENGQLRRWSVSSGHLLDDWITSIVGFGSSLYVGTYAHGVTEFTLDGRTPISSRHFGGGYVNLGGLSVHDRWLYAATMSGLLRRGTSDLLADWQTLEHAAPGIDITSRIVRGGGEVVVTSRRGLGLVR